LQKFAKVVERVEQTFIYGQEKIRSGAKKFSPKNQVQIFSKYEIALFWLTAEIHRSIGLLNEIQFKSKHQPNGRSANDWQSIRG